ncbi:sensor histidine kinase [Leptospira sp. GIMC2001]|uniref:sensor histidine kinase n=1 Tax=Leptospira sp. GIMC2001 TaxID=1513297 RepID=UPI00234A3F99|nr:sensor histidine kinase [Leptospira sp. GIMC2001]WCL48530.1 ATP-binding protein [Leptospira sp. GIMC2001]
MIGFSYKRFNSILLFAIAFSLFLVGNDIKAESCGSLIYDLNSDLHFSNAWQFRKGDNLDWKELSVEESFWVSRNIPDYGISKTENISGYHWYRCKIVLAENFIQPKKPLGLHLGKVRDIDETYFNGVLIGKTGSIVPNMEPDFHKERIYSIPSQLWQMGDNVIAIRVYASGYQQGLKLVPHIGAEETLIRKQYSSENLAIGFGYLFILMGIYFLTGAFIRGLRGENIFFGLFSISIGLYTLIRTQYRYEFFTSFVNSYTFELMILYPLPAFFINFLIFHLDAKRNLFVIAYEVFLAILCLSVPFIKSTYGWNLSISLFNYSLPVAMGISIFYISKDFRQNLPKLRFILIGLVGLLPTILIDSLTALEILSLDGTIYFGFFFFLVLISVQLSEEMVASLQKYIEMESELIRMEKIKTGFLLNISNEFKTGIEKISTVFGKMKTSSSQAKSDKKSWESLDAHLHNTIAMIDEAVLLRKLENKEYFPELSTFEITTLIQQCLDYTEKRLEQKRKTTHISVQPKSAMIQSDMHLMTVIARNLIDNAYIYTDKSVRVDIEFQISPGKFTFSVSDEGLGMNHFEQENLFKKFIRGQKNDSIPGAGIGLTLVKAAVDCLNGEIRVKSSEGMGAMFVVTIPQGKS